MACFSPLKCGYAKSFVYISGVFGVWRRRRCQQCSQILTGRKFGGSQVVAVFYPENKFNEGDFDG